MKKNINTEFPTTLKWEYCDSSHIIININHELFEFEDPTMIPTYKEKLAQYIWKNGEYIFEKKLN